MKQPADGDFLLVAAGEFGDELRRFARLDGEFLHPCARSLPLFARRDETKPAEAGKIREREVVRNRLFEHQPLLLAVLAHHPDTGGEARCGRSARGLPRENFNLAGGGFIESEDGAKRLGATRADQSGDAENLALVNGERRLARLCHSAQSGHAQRCVADRVRHARVDVGDVAPDHQLDARRAVERFHLAAGDTPAVAQHGVAVAKLRGFLEEVRNVNDAHALAREPADDVEKILRIDLREAAGRLVHDEHARRGDERAGDLDHLLLRDRERAGARGERDVVAVQFGERGERLFAAHAF